MDSARGILLFILLLFLLLAPDPQQFNVSRRQVSTRTLETEKYALELLANSQHGDFDPDAGKWLNITGLRKEDGFAWEALKSIQRHVSHQQRIALGQHTPSEVVEAEAAEANGSPLKTDLLVYKNITGVLKGIWSMGDHSWEVHRPRFNLSTLESEGDFAANHFVNNVTGTEGKVQIRLDERKGDRFGPNQGTIREIAATMTVEDYDSSGDSREVRLRGVHYPDYGSVILTTSSRRFFGLFALPQFTSSQYTFNLAKQLLNRTISASIAEQEMHPYAVPTYPWSSLSPGSSSDHATSIPSCEFVVYLQQLPLVFPRSSLLSTSTAASSDVMQVIENELRFPNGVPIPQPPRMKMWAIIYSPDCGLALESKGPPQWALQKKPHLQGWKLESQLRLANHYLNLFTVLCAAQILFLIRQMKKASTPSIVSRISFYTIAMMTLGDGFACMALTVGIFVDAAFLTVITSAFLALMCGSFFGMKFLMDIWTVQAPERRDRQRQAGPTNATSNIQDITNRQMETGGSNNGTLPLPVTATQASGSGAIPGILPPDQDLTAAEAEDGQINQGQAQPTTGSTRREVGALHTRFYLVLLAIIFLSLHATSWPRMMRSAYYHTLAFIYFSFWVPQIYRNVMRNCRKALSWEFVIGQSILRLTPCVYFYTVADNLLPMEPDSRTRYVYIGWIWLQVWALFSQAVLGPRFFVPAHWLPSAYDYHPVLREDDLEDGTKMPLGFSEASGSTQEGSRGDGHSTEKNKKTFDCAICMQNIEVSIVPSGSSTNDAAATIGGVLGRRNYMVTPCRHIFHSQCLEEWMGFRLQCPICRDALVPI